MADEENDFEDDDYGGDDLDGDDVEEEAEDEAMEALPLGETTERQANTERITTPYLTKYDIATCTSFTLT